MPHEEDITKNPTARRGDVTTTTTEKVNDDYNQLSNKQKARMRKNRSEQQKNRSTNEQHRQQANYVNPAKDNDPTPVLCLVHLSDNALFEPPPLRVEVGRKMLGSIIAATVKEGGDLTL